jgi:hypothetical protein
LGLTAGLDSMADAHVGPLIEADAMAGTFTWKDISGEARHANLGPHSIKIVRR